MFSVLAGGSGLYLATKGWLSWGVVGVAAMSIVWLFVGALSALAVAVLVETFGENPYLSRVVMLRALALVVSMGVAFFFRFHTGGESKWLETRLLTGS